MRTLVFIVLLILATLIVNMPRQFTIGPRTFYRPIIALNLSGRPFIRNLEFRLGLDLQGGTHLVYEADTAKIADSDKKSALESTKNNIERRINLLGVSEPLIQTSQEGNSYRLIVELPGVTDVQEALNIIGRTAQLDFRENIAASAGAQPVFNPTDLTGKDLKSAQVTFSGSGSKTSGQPVVSLQFNSDGAKKFADLTKKNIGKSLAIYLDDRLVMAPTVQDEIVDGQAVISGSFTLDQAKQLAIQLNAGALPVPIRIVQQKNIGASLGTESVAKSLFAGLIGLGLVWLFMAANYGFRGLLANLALLIYVLISLSLFKLIPVTLTLAGIAGFILSVGMAVDANILIFERIKEELRWGRPPKAALELGFHRAWSSVRDSNMSSLITAGILFWLGTGSVRGFALTLIVGILVSLFTSITVTRSLLRAFYSGRKKL